MIRSAIYCYHIKILIVNMTEDISPLSGNLSVFAHSDMRG